MIDERGLAAAIDEVEAGLDIEQGQIEVIVPLRGLQMPVARLDLEFASIVRSDTVDVPPEARLADGLGVSPWEPAMLAVVLVDEPAVDRHGEIADVGRDAVEAFRNLVTTLRLFKSGGVGLGPHAWTRLAGDRWRRIATGSGRQRPGGYRLTEGELGELVAFSRSLAIAGTPFQRLGAGRPGFPATLGRSLNRFEAGLERNVVIEALNDHLLALRFILEGGGPADLGLSMRVAALCAEPDQRAELKAIVDRAIGLERELWSGEPATGGGGFTPADTAAALEDLARAILKDAAAGHLGSDLRVTADEILLADGLAVGDGADEQRGSTTEWDLTPIDADELELGAELEQLLPEETVEEPVEEVSELDARIEADPDPEEEELVKSRAHEIFGRQTGQDPETASLELVPAPPAHEPEPQRSHEHGDRAPSPVLRLIEQTRAEREARSNRVSGLFPAPETTEWNVRDITYDRNRRAHVTPE
jgi:hypothetical protein